MTKDVGVATTEIDVQAPDFADEWKQIRDDLSSEADCALRIGRTLIKIRDALKPLGPRLWPAALRKNRMSQPQASRYIRFAEMPESDREVFLRKEGPFCLSAAIGESPRKKKGEVAEQASDYSSTNSRGVEISADELADRLAEVDKKRKRAVEIVDAGVKALAGEPEPEFAADDARWQRNLDEVADAVLAVLGEHLEAELMKRLLPGSE